MTLAMMVMVICGIIISQTQTALARVLDELGPKRKHFLNAKGKISSEQLRKVEKSNRLVTAQLKKTYFDHFPLLGKLTHMYM